MPRQRTFLSLLFKCLQCIHLLFQAQGFAGEDAYIHLLQVLCHDRLKIHLAEDVLLQINARRDLGQGQSLGTQLEYAPFRDVHDLLAVILGIGAGIVDVGALFPEFSRLALAQDFQGAVNEFDLQVFPPP